MIPVQIDTRHEQSVASTLVFIMAMVMYPEVQTKAQAEIDAILGGVRLPEMTDRDSMPYMRSIVKEVFRWKTVVPLGKMSWFPRPQEGSVLTPAFISYSPRLHSG